MIRPTYVYNVIELIDVYDGDTVTVRVDLGMHVSVVTRLRLVGINAPEMSTPEGKPARDYLRSMCASFPSLALPSLVIKTYKDAGDKYGRWLAEIWAGELCLNTQMIAAGFAVAYDGGAKT